MQLDTQMNDVPLAAAAATAQRFERLGFDGAWTFEAAHDPFLPLALGATATDTLELGTNVAIAFGRSPFATALVAWDLQRVSGGRFHLGLGTQVRAHVERRYSMPFEHPAARVTDFIRCLRAIWDSFQTGARPDYDGPYYQFKLIHSFFNPGPIDRPDIPIYLAGVNPRMVRAAGEVADGFHVHPMHSVGYLRDIVRPALAEGAALAGRDVDDIALYAPVLVASADTPAETDRAIHEVRRQIAFYGSTSSYRRILEYHGYNDLGGELNALMRQGDLDEMPKRIPDALVEQIAVVAPPNALARELKQRCDGVLDRVSLYESIAGDADDARWKQFVDDFRAA